MPGRTSFPRVDYSGTEKRRNLDGYTSDYMEQQDGVKNISNL